MILTEEFKSKGICPRRKRHSLVDWFHMKVNEVQDKWASLPNAKLVGTGDSSFVFIPGTRDDRVILVSHSDTVWDDKKIDVGYNSGHYFSKQKGVGIGADDRAGCAMAWKMKDLGHSILIPNAEESGCVGSRFLEKQKEWIDLVNSHKFAIEMDRRHGDDLVFYQIGSKKFIEWCEAKFSPYKKAVGSFTDIGVLCKTICGLNISVGYYGEHTENEILKDNEWHRTLSLMRNVLSEKEIPQFIQDPKEVYQQFNYNQTNYKRTYSGGYNNNDNYYNTQLTIPKDKDKKKYDFVLDSILVCPWCDFTQDVGEWKEHGETCVDCNKEF